MFSMRVSAAVFLVAINRREGQRCNIRVYIFRGIGRLYIIKKTEDVLDASEYCVSRKHPADAVLSFNDIGTSANNAALWTEPPPQAKNLQHRHRGFLNVP